jgi:hypothetical protein
MGEIRDMLDSRPMAEPAWPVCPACGAGLVERVDPTTGRPVEDHGRSLMECPDCHKVLIRPTFQRQQRRYRWVRVLLAVGGFAAMIASQIWRYQRAHAGDGIQAVGLLLILAPAGLGAYALHELLGCAALALSPNNTARARTNWWAYAVFWAAVIGGCIWLVLALNSQPRSMLPRMSPPTLRSAR